jgi:hypothetical protein
VVTVRVEVPQQSQSVNSGRSINPDAVEFFADSYEVIFMKIHLINSNASAEDDNLTLDEYYRGEGNAATGYISVAIPVGLNLTHICIYCLF